MLCNHISTFAEISSILGFFLSAFLVYLGMRFKKKWDDKNNELSLKDNANSIHITLKALQSRLIDHNEKGNPIGPMLRKDIIEAIEKIYSYGKSSKRMKTNLIELKRHTNNGYHDGASDQISAIVAKLERIMERKG